MNRYKPTTVLLRPPKLAPVLRYAVAPVATAVCFAIQYLLHPQPAIVPFAFFYVGVAFAAWLGGLGPGVLASVLSALTGNFFFVAPYGAWSFSGDGIGSTALFLVTSLVIALLAGALRDAVEESERKADLLESVLRQLPAGVGIAGPRGELLHSNAELERIHGGVPLGEGPGARRARAFHSDGRPYRDDEWPIVRAYRGGDAARAEEVTFVRADGSKSVVSASSTTLRDEKGAVIAGIVVDLDITDLKRTEQALREAGRRLRQHGAELQTLFETAPVPLVIARGEDASSIESNRAARELFRTPARAAGQLRGEFRLFHDGVELEPEQWPSRVAAATGAAVEGFEADLRFDDGEVRHLVLSATPVLGEDGWPTGSITAALDVTERRRAADELRRISELVRLSHDAIVVWPLDDGIETWNQGAEALYGYRQDEVIGRVTHELLHTVFPQPWAEIEAQLRANRSWEGDLRHLTKDGREIVVSARLQLAVGEDGVERVLEVNRDITDRRRAEEALRDSNRRKDEFMAMLSHELRNPLAPIHNSLFLLEHAQPDSVQAHHAQEIIRRQSVHLARIVDDLLDVTRIERGKIELKRQRTDLMTLVKQVTDDHRFAFEEAQVRFEVRLPSRPLFADADPTRLGQAIGNVLLNAAKFTPPGGLTTVSLEPDADGEAVLRVRDTGVGMSKELQQRLFQPFAQADRSLERTSGGLGLGLALVKGLVEMHGGTVCARSEGQGKGSEFVFRLPLLEAPSAEPRPAERPVGTRQHRVLIIEDNVDAAESLAEVLELLGHRVKMAHDGVTGLEIAEREAPDVILCDIGLPRMDGYEVARRVRRDAHLRSTYLVALTGYAGPEDLRKAQEAGFDLHMAKPPNLDAIERVVAHPARA